MSEQANSPATYTSGMQAISATGNGTVMQTAFQQPSATATPAQYKVNQQGSPAGARPVDTQVKSFIVSNNTGAAITIKIFTPPYGYATPTDGNYLFWQMSIPANTSQDLVGSNGWYIQGTASVVALASATGLTAIMTYAR